MDSRQLAFITDKLPHQSVSVVNDLETESSDSRINYLSVSAKGNKGNVVDFSIILVWIF